MLERYKLLMLGTRIPPPPPPKGLHNSLEPCRLDKHIYPADKRSRVSANARQKQRAKTVFQSEHVLNSVYNTRFARAAFSADVLEVLFFLFFL